MAESKTEQPRHPLRIGSTIPYAPIEFTQVNIHMSCYHVKDTKNEKIMNVFATKEEAQKFLDDREAKARRFKETAFLDRFVDHYIRVPSYNAYGFQSRCEDYKLTKDWIESVRSRHKSATKKRKKGSEGKVKFRYCKKEDSNYLSQNHTMEYIVRGKSEAELDEIRIRLTLEEVLREKREGVKLVPFTGYEKTQPKVVYPRFDEIPDDLAEALLKYNAGDGSEEERREAIGEFDTVKEWIKKQMESSEAADGAAIVTAAPVITHFEY